MKDQQPSFFRVSADEHTGRRIVYRDSDHGGRPHTDEQREEMRRTLAEDVDAYIAAGGIINSIPMGMTSEDGVIKTSKDKAAQAVV